MATYRSLVLPNPTSPPDGPGAFLSFAQSIAGRILTGVSDFDELVTFSATEYEGAIIHVDEGDTNAQAQDGAWKQITRATFLSTAARNSAYAKASGAFRVAGSLARVGTTNYEHNGGTANTDADWNTLSSLALTKADVATFGTGWTATNTGNHKPRLQRIGDRVFLMGAVTAGSGASLTSILVVPAGFRPTQDLFVGAIVGSSTAGYGEAYLAASTGMLTVPNYGNLSAASGNVLPLGGLNWGLD